MTSFKVELCMSAGDDGMPRQNAKLARANGTIKDTSDHTLLLLCSCQ